MVLAASLANAPLVMKMPARARTRPADAKYFTRVLVSSVNMVRLLSVLMGIGFAFLDEMLERNGGVAIEAVDRAGAIQVEHVEVVHVIVKIPGDVAVIFDRHRALG